MHDDARQAYLSTQVMTATPQKLRLMLIEGALRFARRTTEHWQAGQSAEGAETLIRCRAIISELLAGIRPDNSEIAKRACQLYAFLFQSLTQAQADHDPERLQGVIQVLEVERETWRKVCEELPQPPAALGKPAAPREITAAGAAPIAPGRPLPASPAGPHRLALDA